MVKIIYSSLQENKNLRLPEREPEPEPEPKLSGKELREHRRINEFQLDSELDIVDYFAHKLSEAEQQYSGPINLSQFYLDQAIQSLPQFRFKRNLLTGLISTGIIH